MDQTLTKIGRTLYMTCYWTETGQSLDRCWTKIGFCVQPLSNHTLATSTHFCKWNSWRLRSRWRSECQVYCTTRDRTCVRHKITTAPQCLKNWGSLISTFGAFENGDALCAVMSDGCINGRVRVRTPDPLVPLCEERQPSAVKLTRSSQFESERNGDRV